MSSIISGFFMFLKVISYVNMGAALILLGNCLFMKHRQKRTLHFTALYRLPVQRVMERAAAGEYPCFHHYHASHRACIYRLMLEFAAREQGDFHSIFDYLGFTDDLMAGEFKKNQRQILEDLAVIRSPLSKDYLYMMLLAGDESFMSPAAYALTRLELDQSDCELILPTLINLPLPSEQISLLLNQLEPSEEFCRLLLEERHSQKFNGILSGYLNSLVQKPVPGLFDEPRRSAASP